MRLIPKERQAAMNLRKVFLTLVMFGVWTPVSGQSINLLKNPGGDEGSHTGGPSTMRRSSISFL